MTVKEKLSDKGLVLPELMRMPGVTLPFIPVRVVGTQAYVSGHVPLNPDGSVSELRGKLGADVSAGQGYEAAKLVGLAVLGSLERELGDLNRITQWVRAFGMVNQVPDFDQQPAVINGFSELILDLFGPKVGAHARSAVGMAGLPGNVPVEIEAVVEIEL